MEKMLEYTKKYCLIAIIYFLKSIYMDNKVFVHMLKICQKEANVLKKIYKEVIVVSLYIVRLSRKGE